jgi:GT2 family glycosyltransferase
MLSIPLIVVTYNRPNSLNRLLNSLSKANYAQKVDIIISIDGKGDKEISKIANDLKWNFGNKEIIIHKKNLGLRQHILLCADLSQNYDGIILLEDDLYVSPEFYAYALSAIEYYKNCDMVAGIALYSHAFNETAQFPFTL